ncbi:cell division protein ZapA [Enterocloster citroniae]|uniref:cell division protein ZapA n=1 Tax=Enterocloster citroniae TaxID=358743 RepID=UPI00349E8FA6
MDSKNYTQVLIDGKIYTLGGIEEEAYLQKAASYVNDKNAQMRRLPGFTKQNADYQMVMTELNIADDYFKAMEWGEGMERQKNDMEKETYSLKHELVSTQMKLEAVLKDLEERQKELDRFTRTIAQMEGELKEVREEYEALKSSREEGELSQVRMVSDVKTVSEAELVETVEAVTQAAKTADAGGTEMPDPAQEDRIPAQEDRMREQEAQGQAAREQRAQDTTDKRESSSGSRPEQTGAAEAAATLQTAQTAGISDEELAKRALQAAKKANSHRGGRR